MMHNSVRPSGFVSTKRQIARQIIAPTKRFTSSVIRNKLTGDQFYVYVHTSFNKRDMQKTRSYSAL